MKEFKIRLRAGIGDSLRMLMEHSSIQFCNNTSSLKIYWTYGHHRCIEYTSGCGDCTMNDKMRELFSLVPFLEHVSSSAFDELNVPELWNWETGDVLLRGLGTLEQETQGFKIPMSSTEEIEFIQLFDTSDYTICIQLSGWDRVKQYSTDNLVELFKMILEYRPRTRIFLSDSPKKIVDERLLFDQRIVNLVGKISFRQTFNLIQRVDYFIGPDSYGKYVRKWVNKLQTILCCELGYDASVRDILINCFGDGNKTYWSPGLLFNPYVKLLGASYDKDLRNCKFIDSINDITPEEIFNSMYFKTTKEENKMEFYYKVRDQLGQRAEGFDYIFQYLKTLTNPVIVETGCARMENNYCGDGQSSLLFDQYINQFSGEFVTVDISEKSVNYCKSKLISTRSQIVHKDSITYLKELNTKLLLSGKKIDFLYLDSFDCSPTDMELTYKSALHHLYEFMTILPSLKPGALIAIDDNWTGNNGEMVGKGQLLGDYMKTINNLPCYSGYQMLWKI